IRTFELVCLRYHYLWPFGVRGNARACSRQGTSRASKSARMVAARRRRCRKTAKKPCKKRPPQRAFQNQRSATPPPPPLVSHCSRATQEWETQIACVVVRAQNC